MAEINPDALGILTVCALRYAIGRRSYITGTVADIVRACWTGLNAGDRDVIARDLRCAIEVSRSAPETLGMPQDARTWCDLLAWITETEREEKEPKP